ncbi:hypothetical protein QYE76_003399 [Lolium multiflorum]|uniref:Rhodanese domain-containing protein n=1 Tax=Lolium multiflorum TaxID=4521 RepID=A0AAD8RQ33_LOLMU|nr:hypothetical protein QYE76_003399 [Lolium multiflorum]
MDPRLVSFRNPPVREQQNHAGFAQAHMEFARIGGGRLIDCPIQEYLDEDGDLAYRVLLANGTRIGYMLDPMPLEEAQAVIRELLLTDIRNGRYDFYDMQQRREPWELLPDEDEDGAWEDAAFVDQDQGFRAAPASDEAVADLQETTAFTEILQLAFCLVICPRTNVSCTVQEVRCEMASAYIHSKSEGFENVFELYGGIQRYLEQFPDGGYFDGKNFVFDHRILPRPKSSRASWALTTPPPSSPCPTAMPPIRQTGMEITFAAGLSYCD